MMAKGHVVQFSCSSCHVIYNVIYMQDALSSLLFLLFSFIFLLLQFFIPGWFGVRLELWEGPVRKESKQVKGTHILERAKGGT
jgi:hypothetical protein